MKSALWTVCVFIVAQATLAHAAPEPIGMVVGAQGEVLATAPGATARHLKLKDAVFALDTITTGPGARLQVLFTDDSLFSQGENSAVVLDEYSFDPNHRENNSLCLRIIRGITRVVTGRITDINPERFKVKTSRATIGIRGCELGFDVQPKYDQIMIIRVPAGRHIIIQNDVPNRSTGFAELNITRPMWVKIQEDGQTSRGSLDSRMLHRLSQETAAPVASQPASDKGAATDAPAATDAAALPDSETEPIVPATPTEDTGVVPLSPADELAQDVLPDVRENRPLLENPPLRPPPPPPSSEPALTRTPFFQGGGLGAAYSGGAAQTLSRLFYYNQVAGFISDGRTSVDITGVTLDQNGVRLNTQTLSLRNLPLSRFGSTTQYDGYRETSLSPGVRLANDNLQQFVRRVDLNNPATRLTFWGYESSMYGVTPPPNRVISYDIDEVVYPDARKPPLAGDITALTLRINTRTGTYAEYRGTTPLVFGRIEDLTFFGQSAQGVGFAGQNAAAQQAPSPDGVAFAGFRLAGADQTATTGQRDYYGYASGWATPVEPVAGPTRSLMSANTQSGSPAANEQRVHITLDKDAYQNNVNTDITVCQTPATPALSDLHLGTPQSSGYVVGDDFAARYGTADTTVHLNTQQGGADWVWGEWNGEAVNPASGDTEAVQGTFTAGRTLSPTEYIGLVNGAVGYSLNTPSTTPGYATAYVSGSSGQSRIDGTSRLNVSIPGGGATALWSGNFYLGTPGDVHLAAQVMPTAISSTGHLLGMPTGGYVLNANGTTYSSSSLDGTKPQGFTGSLVGPGTGTRPITGAIGSGNFTHTDGTTVTLTYGTSLSP